MARTNILDVTDGTSDQVYSESKTIALDANNTTKAHRLFTVTGSVLVKKLYGVVTTALGSNLTAAHWRTNDQTATVPISLATGTTISSASAGSVLTRLSIASVAFVFDNASAAKVRDPVAATAPDVFMPFAVVQKTGSIQTDIEFVYTTTNTPTSGEIMFVAEFEPLTPGSDLRAV